MKMLEWFAPALAKISALLAKYEALSATKKRMIELSAAFLLGAILF